LAQFSTDPEPFFDLLGMRVEKVAPDFCRMRLPFRPELQQAGGLVHGGAIASLIDSAGVMAIKGGVDSEVNGVPTITMTVNYLAPARGTDVLAEARIIRRGRSIVFAEVKALSPSGEFLATAQVVYKFGTQKKST
jgi:uncharacterized protein (TIGR00369 family)